MTASRLYQPDDARIAVASLEFLRTAEGVRLRRRIAELPEGGLEPTVAQVAELRRDFSAGPTHAALTLATLQAKGVGPRGKFPVLSYVWATPEALEQATHMTVGRHKAERMARLGVRQVFDLCAGMGGDALAFAEKMAVTAVERSPVRAACLRFNALDCVPPLAHRLEVREEDVEEVLETLPVNAWVHIDPARRAGGKRSVRYEDLVPGPRVLERLVSRRGGGGCAIKLSPAVDFASLPAGHVELISHRGSVVQALLWTGTPLAAHERTASVLGSGEGSWSLTAQPRAVEIGLVAPQAPAGPMMMYELDGAVTRAGLAQVVADALRLVPLTMDGGYLMAQSPPGPSAAPPWTGDVARVLTAFEVRAIVPLGQVVPTLASINSGAPGPVEVKARGNLPGIDTDELQTKWRKACGRACTVLLFRQEKQTLAAVGFRADGRAAMRTEGLEKQK